MLEVLEETLLLKELPPLVWSHRSLLWVAKHRWVKEW